MQLPSARACALAAILGFCNFTGANAATINDCPGYVATNVQQGSGKLTADLNLAGKPCNVYGSDISSLRLLVEYQTSDVFCVIL